MTKNISEMAQMFTKCTFAKLIVCEMTCNRPLIVMVGLRSVKFVGSICSLYINHRNIITTIGNKNDGFNDSPLPEH